MQGVLCVSDFSIAFDGKSVITAHVRGKHHKDMALPGRLHHFLNHKLFHRV